MAAVGGSAGAISAAAGDVTSAVVIAAMVTLSVLLDFIQGVFGDVSTGVQNDLQLATDMVRHMVTQYGMSEQLGLATFEQAPAPLIYPPSLPEKKGYSERTAQAIDAEIAKLLDQAHQRVKETLIAKRELLDALAHALLEKEPLDRAALDVLLDGHGAESIRRVGGAD